MIDQNEQRRRRRQRLAVVYTGSFDLTAEVQAIAGPIAERVAAQRTSSAYLGLVEDLAGAVGAAVAEADKMIAEVDHRRRTAHITNSETRQRALALLRNSYPRPAIPEIDVDDVLSGTWADVLVEHTRPVSGPLQCLLTVARPPGATRGALSASERIEATLRQIDSAAITIERRLDRRAADRASIKPPKASTADAIREELLELGVST